MYVDEYNRDSPNLLPVIFFLANLLMKHACGGKHHFGLVAAARHAILATQIPKF